MNSNYMYEEAGKSKYAYFSSSLGLVCVEILDIEQKPKYKMGLVLRDESFEIPSYGGVFSHNNIIYLVGGLLDIMTEEHNDFLLKFDHNLFQQFPPHTSMADFRFLEKSVINYAPMMVPQVIPAGDTTYFLHDTYLHDYPEAFGFQSFSAHKNCFEKLPNPPVPRPPPDRDPKRGLFLVGSCIYLFVAYGASPSIYTFDILSKQWKQNKSLESQFRVKRIPAPLDHRGDVVLSDECPHDKTRIMVALHLGCLIAYRVRFVEGWESFDLISFRFLEESHIPPSRPYFDPWTHLTDFGGRRFCVIRGSECTDFLMYVVSIDFEEEHRIQELKDSEPEGVISSTILSSEEHRIQELNDSDSKGMISSTILSYEVFDLKNLKDLPPGIHPRVRPEVCFLAAPPPSPEIVQEKMIIR